MDPEVEESPGSVSIESSTDTVEQVEESFSAEIEESQEAEKPAEKPPAKEGKPPKQQQAAEEEESEDEEESDAEEEGEEEAVEEEEKPAKKPPTVVSRKRLNEVITQRNQARQRAADAERRLQERDVTPKKEDVAAEPQTYSGEPEPQIEDYLDKPDKYPDPYAAFTKAHGFWVRKETLAEVAANEAATTAQGEQRKLIQGFADNVKKAVATRLPDFREITDDSDVEVSALMQLRIYKSEYGPDMLVHLVQHPEVAEEMRAMEADDQVAAMTKLERKLLRAAVKAEAEEAEDDEEVEEEAEPEKPGKLKPKTGVPPKKPISKTPAPPARLKPTGAGPKTLEELAGPVDRTGIDIDFNPAYERAVNAQRKK